MTEVVYAAEWPGFPGEAEARRIAANGIYDQEQDDEFGYQPDWLTMTEVFKAEEAAAMAPAIYDYEVEMKKPVPQAKKASWRQRAKRMMGRANDTLRDLSIGTLVTAQAKSEQLRGYYDDEEDGHRRRKITGVVAGALALGAVTYLRSKGVDSGGSTHQPAAEAASSVMTPLAADNFDFEAFAHVPAAESSQTTDAVQTVHAAHVAPAGHDASVTVHSGENPWTISEDQLIAKGDPYPSVAQIEAYNRDLAAMNPDVYRYGDDSSRYIPAGTKLRLP